MPRKYIRKDSYKKYSESDFQLAIELVEKGSSMRDTAKRFLVLYTTLNTHINCQNLYNRADRPTKFNQEEEEDNLEQTALVKDIFRALDLT